MDFVMSDFADFEYKCTDYYFPEDEYCLLWNDGEIGIEWPSLNPTISDKDRMASYLEKLRNYYSRSENIL